MPRYQRSTRYGPRASTNPITGRYGSSGVNQTTQLSGSKRHDFIQNTILGVTNPMLPNTYAIFDMAKFKRTFTAANDTVDTPSLGNNYETAEVMNGSKVTQFKALLRLNNVSATVPAYVDIFVVALSFWDAFIWNGVHSSLCPFTFSIAVGPPDLRGEVDAKAPVATIINMDKYKSVKFQQHYLKHLGSVYLTPSDGGKPNVEISVPMIPPKCRRSQTGMLYSLIVFNDNIKNNAATIALDSSIEVSFMETPSDNRIPYAN